MYHVNVSYGLTQSVEYVTTTPSVEVEGIDYDRQIIISITSINCHSESESAFYNLTISEAIIVANSGLTLSNKNFNIF